MQQFSVHFWVRGTSALTLVCLVLMHVEKLITSLLVAIQSPGESSLLSVPRPCLNAGAWETRLRVLFPASDELPLSYCTAVFNFLLFILSWCYRKMHHVPPHDSSPVCSWISGAWHHGHPFRGMLWLGGISSCGSCVVWPYSSHHRTASTVQTTGQAHTALLGLSLISNRAVQGPSAGRASASCDPASSPSSH